MIEIRPVQREELTHLREVAILSFVKAFAQHNTPANMEFFLHEAYDPDQLLREWEEKNAVCYMAWEEKSPLGFVRIRRNAEVNDYLGENSIELHRLYVHPEHQGKKVGSLLMQHTLNYAVGNKFEWVWLGVWEGNTRAQEFYYGWGFEKFSQHVFQMGDDPQIDWLLRKKMVLDDSLK